MTRQTERRPNESPLEECPRCKGECWIFAPRKVQCERCKGKGFIKRGDQSVIAPFVVKVQLSLATTHSRPQVLLYNEDRSVYWQDNAGDEIVKSMNGRSKAYFNAFCDGSGVIQLGEEVADPGW